MQIGIAHLVAFFVGMAMIVGGAFAAGTKWHGDTSTETAAAVSALDDSESGEAFIDEEVPAPTGEPLYKVLRVVDGDTIVIEKDGRSESVRLIGVDTPELNDSRTGVQCFAKEATEETKRLVTGKSIRLEKDDSQGERDKYKRLLGYVFLENGASVNLALVKGGYAHEYTYDGAYKYQKQFKAAQAEAKAAEAGLWAPDACPPEKPAAKAAPKTTSAATQTAAAAAAKPAATKPKPEPKPEPTPEPKEEKKEETKPEPTKEVDPEPADEPQQDSSDIICSRNAYNCTDFNSQEEAQKVYDQCGGVGNDIHRLDNNKDGSACDSLR